MKNFVSRYEYVNVKHRNNCGYMKIETHFGIRLLAENIFIRVKHTMFNARHKLFFLYFDLIARIANFFHCLVIYYVVAVTTICSESPDGMSIN